MGSPLFIIYNYNKITYYCQNQCYSCINNQNEEKKRKIEEIKEIAKEYNIKISIRNEKTPVSRTIRPPAIRRIVL